jgi:uncharacterized membrane protein
MTRRSRVAGASSQTEASDDMSGSLQESPLAPLVSAVVTVFTLLLAFGLMSLGVEDFWVVFVVGFGGVLPVSLGVLSYRHRQTGGTTTTDTRSGTDAEAEAALEELRLRYARGEFTDAEFEHRVERLLETTSAPETRQFWVE